MPIKGAWLAAATGQGGNEAAANKWGNGVNPIHGLYGGPGRNTTPDTPGGTVTQDIAGNDDYGYTDEDVSANLYGYNYETGTRDRAAWGTEEQRNNTDGWPQYGPYEGGIPGGTEIRSMEHGAQLGAHSKQQPDEPWGEGWQNKVTDGIDDAGTSDPSQYEIQTSMRQRDQTRAGSQSSGTASEYSAPIKSRIVGKRLKFWPTGDRNADMEPKSQDIIVRPFWNRTAGTGNPEWLEPNAMYVSEPYTRVPPPDADQGATASVVDNNAGYTDEDLGVQW